MLVFESPGPRGGIKNVQMKNLQTDWANALKSGDIPRLVDVCRRGFHSYWILGIQRRFFNRFFGILNRHQIIATKDVNEYLNNERYWQDLFITDAALCSGVRGTLQAAAAVCRPYLKRQIEIADPELILSFGNEALHSLKRLFGEPKCYPKGTEATDNVTHCHGYLLEYERFMVIPLAHLSREYMTLRDSYFEYFSEGLRTYSQMTSASKA
jgi:hypothetical protein